MENNQRQVFYDLLQDGGAFNMLMVSITNRNALTSIAACKESLALLDNISEAVNDNKLPDERKNYIRTMLRETYAIVNGTYNALK